MSKGVWSEHQQGRRQTSDDIMIGVNAGADSLDIVSKEAKDAGVEATFDCGHCGKQTRFFTPWLELACYYRGEPDPRTGRPFKGTAPTNQGMLVRLRGARCNRINKVLWSWPEVEELVREGVRLRRLPHQVLSFPQR